VIFDWASFALGALACILSQVLWAACYTSGFLLRLFRKGHIADLLGTLLMWALVIAAGVAAVWAVNEALFLTAVSIRKGVF
jgi:hypothetical protein